MNQENFTLEQESLCNCLEKGKSCTTLRNTKMPGDFRSAKCKMIACFALKLKVFGYSWQL